MTEAYLCGDLCNPHVVAHLSTCASCTKRIAEEAEFSGMLKDGLAEEPIHSRELEMRVRNTIGLPAPSVARSSRWVQLRYAFVPTMALTVLLVASIPFIQVEINKSALCVDAADDHHVEIIEKSPRIWKSGGEITELVRAASLGSNLPERIAPPGYQLAGARICSLHGKRYVHLLYAKGSEQLSIFVRHEEHQSWAARALNLFSAHDVKIRTFEGLSVASLQKNDLSLVVVSAGSKDEALAFTNLAAQQL